MWLFLTTTKLTLLGVPVILFKNIIVSTCLGRKKNRKRWAKLKFTHPSWQGKIKTDFIVYLENCRELSFNFPGKIYKILFDVTPTWCLAWVRKHHKIKGKRYGDFGVFPSLLIVLQQLPVSYRYFGTIVALVKRQ